VDAELEEALATEFLELDQERKRHKKSHKKRNEEDHKRYNHGLVPTSSVTYGRDDYSSEHFNNRGGRAVFKRRAKEQQVVRFEKTISSSGGQAVVKGVTKLPCGKDVTDKGLFASAISEKLSNPVPAGNPSPPQWVDDNIRAIKRLPVVPDFHSKGGLDEYGDPIE